MARGLRYGTAVGERLLLVDDEEAILTGMRRFFEAHGYHVDCASEREEADALLDCVAYDCVVVDLCLTPAHGADGLEIITHVRSRLPNLPIVVLTAHGSEAVEAEARERGADAFLRKPQALRGLDAVIRDLVQVRA